MELALTLTKFWKWETGLEQSVRGVLGFVGTGQNWADIPRKMSVPQLTSHSSISSQFTGVYVYGGDRPVCEENDISQIIYHQ